MKLLRSLKESLEFLTVDIFDAVTHGCYTSIPVQVRRSLLKIARPVLNFSEVQLLLALHCGLCVYLRPFLSPPYPGVPHSYFHTPEYPPYTCLQHGNDV